jgi:hypothetical protein
MNTGEYRNLVFHMLLNKVRAAQFGEIFEVTKATASPRQFIIIDQKKEKRMMNSLQKLVLCEIYKYFACLI